MSRLSAVEAIFHSALTKGSLAERAAYLEEACAGDRDLRQEVERLLLAEHQLGDFLDPSPPPKGRATQPIERDIPASEEPVTRLGPYKILQQIGEGGFGVVYLAEQEYPVRRKVAIKIVKPGMDSAQILARFEQERQALAMMDHQNIARVFDAGTIGAKSSSRRSIAKAVSELAPGELPPRAVAGDALALDEPSSELPHGRPYFVMELVKGVPITKYCDDHHLTPRERLELFVPVCRAIQHAHQKGIIHRDIKPSNVLVTLYDGKPVPKVIDFGVAKAIEQKLTDRTLFTQFGQVIGTLEYMSPEQAEVSALDIDTRSDIYSLGVMLYELLTGTTPLDRQQLREAGYSEVLRMIREVEPPKPSTRLSDSKDKLASISAQRKMEPTHLARVVRGELDWIVMKALEKDRSRRYETANGLARDIERYLADEPVEACPPSAGYKVGKFARKHKKTLATLAAFAGLLVAGFVVCAWLAIRARQAERRADERFELAKDAVDRYLNQVTETPELKNANLLELRKKLLEAALPFFQKLAEQAPGDPEREGARGGGYLRVGQIHDELGEHAVALTDFEQARTILERLAEANPNQPDYAGNLAASYYQLGRIRFATGQPEAAESAYQSALAIQKALVHQHPDEAKYNQELGKTQNSLGILLNESSRFEEAKTFFLEALQRHEKLVAESPTDPKPRQELARVQTNLANLQRRTGPTAAALAGYRKVLETQEKLAADFPTVNEYRADLARSYRNLGVVLHEMGQSPDAEAPYRRALALNLDLNRNFPAVPRYRLELARTYSNLGQELVRQSRWAEAESALLQATTLQEKLVSDFPSVTEYAIDQAGCYGAFASFLREHGRRTEALDWFAKSITVAENILRRNPQRFQAKLFLRNNYLGRAITLGQLQRHTEAAKDWKRTLELSPAKEHLGLEMLRARFIAKSGQASLASKMVEDGFAKASAAPDEDSLYSAACALALSSGSNGTDPKQQEAYAVGAIELLKRLASGGWNEVSHLSNDPDMISLRSRPDFRKLVAELESHSKPTEVGHQP